MNSSQFAWLYLVEHGQAGVEHSYYSGYRLKDERMKHLYGSWNNTQIKNHYLKEIKDIGVNWNKTKAPISELKSEFEGTFNDSSEKEYLTGTIILNNGMKQSWIAENIEITNVFNMMAAIENSKSKFKEYFNET